MAFKMFDKDGSGTLSIDEIKEMFNISGGISENVWKAMLSEVDDNGDGSVNIFFYLKKNKIIYIFICLIFRFHLKNSKK